MPPVDPSLRELDDCGCCEGTGAVVPLTIANRPGLPAIAYRVGSHATFKRSLLAGLSDSSRRALQGLKTREDDDLAIALLDGWATVADVLTFYGERIANESYLRTATERRSVLELARSIGYELNPGVAASTLLTFTLEDAQGAPTAAVVDAGTKVQSVPKPGQRPQTFETLEALDARVEWNELRPRQTRVWEPVFGDRALLLSGVATDLRPGDSLLIVGNERKSDAGSERWDVRTLTSVEPDAARGVTRVTWARGLGSVQPHIEPAGPTAEVYALRLRAPLFGSTAPDWRTLHDTVRNHYLPAGTVSLADEWPNLTIGAIALAGSTGAKPGLFGAYFDDSGEPTDTARFERHRLTRVDPQINFNWGGGSPHQSLPADRFSVRWTGKVVPPTTGSWTFITNSDDGVRLFVGGSKLIDDWHDHGPTKKSGAVTLQGGREYDLVLEYYENGGGSIVQLSWSGPAQAEQIIPPERFRLPYDIHLGSSYPEILSGSWLVLSGPYSELYKVLEAEESSRKGFTLALKTTRVRLEGENLEFFDGQVREVAVLGRSERLAVAELPIEDGVTGKTVDLDRLVTDLPKGRTLVFSGRRLRVRVEQQAAGLALVPAGPTGGRPLVLGEQLIVVAPPAATGPLAWRLLDATGFEGTVAAPAGSLTLVHADPDDPLVSERVTLEKSAPLGTEWTQLTLASPLATLFDRTSVTIAANVAGATHGEATVREVLGSGNAAVPFQRFSLHEQPLTYVPVETTSGGESTLEVRIDDVRWDEVPSLFARGPRERVYATRVDDGGQATVEFGDGESGARPPTGRENIVARYRKGTGSDGNVDSGQLTLLLTRPLGVRSVVNPVSATGGQDPQALADARANAPITVLTLGRVVSLRDYEDFARSFAGVTKAAATWTWNVDRRGVLVTIAGIDGAPVAADDPLRDRLRKAILNAADRHVPVVVRSYSRVPFRVAGTIDRDPAYEAPTVLGNVETALEGAFSFGIHTFGQPVALSEVVEVAQRAEGVVAIDVDLLYRGSSATWTALLQAASPQPGDDASTAPQAELLVLDLRTGDLKVRA